MVLSLQDIADTSEAVSFVSGIILNAFLIYVIRRFSRANIGTYKNLLQIFAAYDIFLSILQAVANPGSLVIGTTLGVVTDTPFRSRAITSFYCALFTTPFALLNIHFLYRFWSISRPHCVLYFSNKQFVSLLALCPIGELVAWFMLVYYGCTGDLNESGTILLSKEFEKKYGRMLNEGWIVMDYWENGFNIRMFCMLIGFDLIMIASFSIAVTLGSLTFYHIKKADKISKQAHQLQWKLFIAVCAQTLIPTVFVYIPYFCVINFPFFDLPLFFLVDAGTWMTACFPAFDAIIIILLIRDYRVGVVSMFRRTNSISMESTTNVVSVMPSTAVLTEEI